MGNWTKGMYRFGQGLENGGRLGCLQQAAETGWGPWWGASGYPQVRENLDDHFGIFDSREDGQRATALWTGGNVDGEDSLE